MNPLKKRLRLVSSRTKKLDEILRGMPGILRAEATAGVEITGLAYDSQRVRPGYLFSAVPGFKIDGHEFAGQAREAGAAAILTGHWLEDAGLPQIQVESVRKAMALAARNFWDSPSRSLALIGVTGTNGKTTTTYLIDSILRENGMTTGLIGGIEYRIGEHSFESKRTTPEAIDLDRMLADMSGAGVNAAAIEVSSHGIDLYRVAWLDFSVAVFTNLTRDHLDLHGDMEKYYQSKRSLFTGTLDDPRNPDAVPSGQVPAAAINIDGEYGLRLARELSERGDALSGAANGKSAKPVTFGINADAVVRAGNIEYAGWETRFDLLTPSGQAPVVLKIPGAYNLENSLAAAAAATALAIPVEATAAGLSASPGAPGRFEPVDIDAPFRVVVDYAHNEDGLSKAITNARALTPGKVIIVFGSPGERDRDKRPGMGRVAGDMSDLAILTTDDCYGEPPEQILDETEAGLLESDTHFFRIPDRRQAIETAIEAAREGDTILIAGKGHETRQIMATGSVPFNDREVVLDIIGAKNRE
ncbi:MAG: UDP-N-acetylmuramoyl-L-alanyl-D-glutamate--2,6-diaminopimelate ligase [Thermoleophilia bacterium]